MKTFGTLSEVRAVPLILLQLDILGTSAMRRYYTLVYGAVNDLFTLTSLIYLSGMRGHTYKLFHHCNRVDLHKNFFSQRITDT